MNKSPKEEKNGSEEKKGFRSYFLKLFDKYGLRNEEQFTSWGKWLIFIILVLLEVFMVMEHVAYFEKEGGWGVLISLLALETLLTLSQAFKLFIVKTRRIRIGFFIFDALISCSFMFLVGGMYAVVTCMLVLTEFYIAAEKTRFSFVLLCMSSSIYIATYLLREYYLIGGSFDILPILTSSLSSVFALFAHFLIVHIGLAFYRQFVRLNKALKELDESKKELEKAYAVVAEVTALEERQRIAKDIHDTAGHSITTVIMQTEAAKLILDKNVDEARSKIIAANLQAKHALEELRDSVHLLSGNTAAASLKESLKNIIHESTDGTGITIRSSICEAEVSPAKFRFLCNTLKEGISNGLRHGGATAFWFELKTEGKQLQFLLSDNGKGCEKEELKLGFGLSSMQERAKALGGEIKIQTEEGEGFELTLVLPA